MQLTFIHIDNTASGSFRSRVETGMPGKLVGMSKNSKPMPCIRHRSRASSTSFSGNCGAKFGRKLTNLSETTADDTDNADEENSGEHARPRVLAKCPVSTGFSLQGRSASRPLFFGLSGIYVAPYARAVDGK